LFTSTDRGASGPAGNITVNATAFRIADGAIVSAQTLNPSAGGNVNINAKTFEAANGGQVLTTSSSDGNAGNITLKVTDNITLSGIDPTNASRLAKFGRNIVTNEGAASGLFASTSVNSTGNGGSIVIDPSQLTIANGAIVSVSSLGRGRGGNIYAQANSILLDQGELTANSAAGGDGDIRLYVPDLLLLRHNSLISATSGTAQVGGNGGNFTLDTKLLVAIPSENSDILTNAFTGNGGSIRIAALGIVGTQPRRQVTPESDIVASGAGGETLVTTYPILGVVVLPKGLVDASRLIAQGCPAYAPPQAKKIAVTPSPQANLSARTRNRNTDRERTDAANDPIAALSEPSKFVVSGRGGIPPSPTQPLSSDAVLTNWATLTPQTNHRSGKAHSSNLTSPPPTQIVEATGWMIGPKGEVILKAPAPTVTPDIPWLRSAECYAQ